MSRRVLAAVSILGARPPIALPDRPHPSAMPHAIFSRSRPRLPLIGPGGPCFAATTVTSSAVTAPLLVASVRTKIVGVTTRHKLRTAHNVKWWTTRPTPLSSKRHEERPIYPKYPAFNEEVDRPPALPKNAECMNCKKAINPDVPYSYVWIPSGNAMVPTTSGYFFHYECFRCSKCGFRFFYNKFCSHGGRAVCPDCSIGRHRAYPTRRWHVSYVESERFNSRFSGHQFPRHKSQIDFLNNPET